MCNKIGYDSKSEARHTAMGMSADRNITMEACKCSECEQWHLRTAGKRHKVKRVPAMFDYKKYPHRLKLESYQFKQPKRKKRK